jgi:hypothetical protein
VARSGEGGCWVRPIVVVVAVSWCRCVGEVAAPSGVDVVKAALVVVVAGGVVVSMAVAAGGGVDRSCGSGHLLLVRRPTCPASLHRWEPLAPPRPPCEQWLAAVKVGAGFVLS